MKKCTMCKEEKIFSDFHKNKKVADGYMRQCKSCNINRVNKWNKSNPWTRERHLKRHGLSLDQFNLMLEKQNKCCAICESKQSVLHVDHNHNCCPGSYGCSKCIRQLLCSNCNTALGLVKENKTTLLKMIKYLGG